MDTKDMLAESSWQILGKINILESSHDGLWEIYQLKKLDYIVKLLTQLQSNKSTRLLCCSQGYSPSKQLFLPLRLPTVYFCGN